MHKQSADELTIKGKIDSDNIEIVLKPSQKYNKNDKIVAMLAT